MEPTTDELAALTAKIHAEMPEWYRYLNTVAGVLAFTLALGSASTLYPELYGALSLVFWAGFLGSTKDGFSPTLSALRLKADKTEIERLVWRGIEAELFTWKKMFTGTLCYWTGCFFLLFVTFGGTRIVAAIYGSFGRH